MFQGLTYGAPIGGMSAAGGSKPDSRPLDQIITVWYNKENNVLISRYLFGQDYFYYIIIIGEVKTLLATKYPNKCEFLMYAGNSAGDRKKRRDFF